LNNEPSDNWKEKAVFVAAPTALLAALGLAAYDITHMGYIPYSISVGEAILLGKEVNLVWFVKAAVEYAPVVTITAGFLYAAIYRAVRLGRDARKLGNDSGQGQDIFKLRGPE
jgi:hypothetical protein